MKKMTPFERILLLVTGLLAAYQVAVGVEGSEALPLVAYTVSFGVLLVAGLLLIILGFEVLENPAVVIVSSTVPLALSLGLVWDYLPAYRYLYLAFAIIGFLAIVLTRLIPFPRKLATVVLAVTHGIAGLTIFFLPIAVTLSGQAEVGFLLVGVGGALIGLGGLLLSFLKAGKPILSGEAIMKALPVLLLLMTVCFVAGFALA